MVLLSLLMPSMVACATPMPIPAAWHVLFPSLRMEVSKEVNRAVVGDRYLGGNRTAESASTHQGMLRVAVISDLNGSYGSTSYGAFVHGAIAEIIERRPDVVLCAGDMVAGQHHGLNYRAMWQGFHQAVSQPLEQAGIPLLITAGNHDGPMSRRYAYQRKIYKDEWMMRVPKVQFVDQSHYPEYYSVAMGSTLFIAIDSSTVGPLSTTQMKWLKKQLKHADAYTTKIVFGHVPQWAVSVGREREIIGDQNLVDLFERYGVDAFITGHDHAYYPGARDTTRYIAAPALGSGPRSLLAPYQERSPRGFVEFYVSPEGGLYDVESWKAPDFKEVDDRRSLPAKVGTSYGPLVRDDLLGLHWRSLPIEERPASVADSTTHEPKRLDTRADEPVATPQKSKKMPRSNHEGPVRALPADVFEH